MSEPAFAEAFAEAAGWLVGVPFRLHGRDPHTGLDCVGVLASAGAAAGAAWTLPSGYALRHARVPDLDGLAAGLGFVPASGTVRRGDVLALRPGPGQVHFAITTAEQRFVHAHAGLGRVVEGELPEGWPCLFHWRPMLPRQSEG
ncbi:hypothetical protein [Novosphingobium colocasiae]|uniref:hypothetical protein n=1 Tax=Novosphingobium colocasiae TaxID=1256513 RepID=UPI0035B485C4